MKRHELRGKRKANSRKPADSGGVRLRRRGYTLLEMIVAISLIMVLMTVSGALFVALSRSERNAQRAAAAQQTIARLDDLFRRDVHQAQSAIIAQDDRQHAALTLTLPAGRTVRYTAEDSQLVRLAEFEAKSHRDDFRIPSSQWEFDIQGSRVELRLKRPADTVTQNSPALVPLRECRLMALLSLTPAQFQPPGGTP